MKTSISFLAGCLLALTAVPAQSIQLKDGRVIIGRVTDATGDGLTFRRIDNGGLLVLGWDDLSALSAGKIKRSAGLVVEDAEEALVEVDVIVYAVPGAGLQEVFGITIEWTQTELRIKRRTGVLPIKRSDIKKTSKRLVPVLDVYTLDEYYAQLHEEHAPGNDADKHILLAEDLRRIGDFARAEKHLLEAETLGGSRQSGQLPAMIQRVRTLAEAEEERELLSQIRIMRNRDKFDRAAELIEEFGQRFPDSKLQSDLDRERQRFIAAREAYFVDKAIQRWDWGIRHVAKQKVGPRDVTLAECRSSAEDGMAEAVFASIAGMLEIDEAEIAEFWSRRSAHRKPHAHMYNYGVGSWVLGADAIVEGTNAEDTGSQGGGGGTADRDLDRLIRLLKENQKSARRAAANRRGGDGEETDEDWWASAKRDTRVTWLRAYFAENGGQMEFVAAYVGKCGNCSGAGHTVLLGDTGGERKQECPVCHGTKYTRAVRAR